MKPYMILCKIIKKFQNSFFEVQSDLLVNSIVSAIIVFQISIGGNVMSRT